MLANYSFLLNIFAGLFLSSAQLIYIVQVVKKQVTPSVITWSGWSFLVGIALVSQWIEFGWEWTLVGHLFSALGCTFIALFALLSKNYTIYKKDWVYLLLGVSCILLYVISSNALLTTLFAILADFILGIPTFIKAIKNPVTEKSKGWNIAIISWTLTILTCYQKELIYFLFPFYCLLFNMFMSYFTSGRRIRKVELN